MICRIRIEDRSPSVLSKIIIIIIIALKCVPIYITSCMDASQSFCRHSRSRLEMSSTGTGIFSGTLNTRLPKDGKIKYAGYCNITSYPKERSFRRTIYHDWSQYTHLVLRIRGDGRTYALVISNKSFYDLTWHDQYHYPMYTRGGPYWQHVRIPFSRFVFSSKGRVQDDQFALMLHEVSGLGITVADDISGSFRLEIAYIGLEYDYSHTEECAYESYNFKGVKF